MKSKQFFSIFLFLVMFFFTNSSLKAQETWSLKRCVEFGTQNNISIKQQELLVQSSASTYSASKEGRMPDVSANASQNLRTGRSIDQFTNQLVTQTVLSNSFGINGQITLFNGFQQTNIIKQNEANYKANQLDVEQTKRNISLNIANAYLQVLLSDELLEAAKAQLKVDSSQIERSEKLLKAGTVAEAQIITLRAQLASDQVAVITAQNQVSFSKLQLMQFMNLPLVENFQVEKISIETITNDNFNKTPNEIYQIAEKNQFSIQSADMRTKSSRIAIDIANGARMPTLTLSAGVNSFYSSAAPRTRPVIAEGFTTTPTVIGFTDATLGTPVTVFRPTPNFTTADNLFFNQLDFNLGTSIALNLNIPIYTGGAIKNSVRQAKITQQNNEFVSQNTKIQLRQTIEQSYNDMKAAASSFEARKSQVESLENAFKVTQTRFNVGATNSVDYNLAKINVDRAKTDLIRSKYEYVFRIKVLDFYQNKPILD